MNTPVLEMLRRLECEGFTRMHMPGHKGNPSAMPELLSAAVAWDFTEIPGSDNLHRPEGAIAASQRLCAAHYGAMETFYLVNGATCGLHSAILAAVPRGSRALVQRDAHRAVWAGLMLAGAEAVHLQPSWSETEGLPLGVTPAGVEETLKMHEGIALVIVTSPSYYGIAADIAGIAAVCRRYGVKLLVDEAHGAHFGLCSGLPDSAVSQGADMVVQSAHKTLPALTQTAWLHLGPEAPADACRFWLSSLQSSSPSYLLMAGLDNAQAWLRGPGPEAMALHLRRVTALITAVDELPGLRCLPAVTGGFYRDITRVVVDVRGRGLSGYRAEALLREAGVQAEMATPLHVVFITTPADTQEDLHRLRTGLAGLPENPVAENHLSADLYYRALSHLPERGMEAGAAVMAAREAVPVSEASGRTAAVSVIPYPPGVPLLVPGDVIGTEALEVLMALTGMGSTVMGIENGTVCCVQKTK